MLRVASWKPRAANRSFGKLVLISFLQMKYLLANRIFMFFPGNLMVSCLVTTRVAWQHPGMCREVMGLNQCMSPLGAFVTIAQSIAVTPFYSWTCWGRSVFPPNPALFLPLGRALGRCFCSSVFECPRLYWARKCLILFLVDLSWSQNMILLKWLWAFCS